MSETAIKQVGSIVEKTVLLRVNFRIIGNSRKVSPKILALGTQANVKLLKINKTLFESKELEAIRKADNIMRAELHDMCVPYDMGLDLLPRESVNNARQRMTEFRETRKALVSVFVDTYPQLLAEGKERLSALAEELSVPVEYLYNPMDYPPMEHVSSKFGFDWDFLELTVPDELKLSGKFEEASANLAEKISNVQEEITLVMREALLDLVSHLKESLEPSADGKTKRLHGTTITNLQEFLTSLPARNVTNDAELQALADEVSTLVHSGVNADMLRKDEAFKQTVIDGMGSIAGKLSTLVETVPGRKFRG